MSDKTINGIRVLMAVTTFVMAALLVGRAAAGTGAPEDAGCGELCRRTADRFDPAFPMTLTPRYKPGTPLEASPSVPAHHRAHVDQLMHDLHRGEDESVIRLAMLEVGIAHHLVTKYTILVVVAEVITTENGGRTVPVANALPHGSPLSAHLEDGKAHPPWGWADMHPIGSIEVPGLAVRRVVLSGTILPESGKDIPPVPNCRLLIQSGDE